jgi:nitrilase
LTLRDEYPKFKAASVHASPVFLNRDATAEKACSLISEAAGAGAELVVFPEVFIPGYPYWIWLDSPNAGRVWFKELFKNAVELPSKTIECLCDVARESGMYVVMGINERDGYTLYNTIVFIDKCGKVLGRHRKIEPTQAERTFWGRGNGSDLVVYDTDLGKISGLICGNNRIDILRCVLIALGEQIHTAHWPALSALKDWKDHVDFIEVNLRHHALSGGVFVISASDRINSEMVSKLGHLDLIKEGGGWSAIIAPNGQILSNLKGREGIIYADIDMEKILDMKYVWDTRGHYARWDVASILLNRDRYTPIREEYSSSTRGYIKELLDGLKEKADRDSDEELKEITEKLKKSLSNTLDKKQ